MSWRVTKIVSGGQTGVDRGALDAAIALGIEHGGWCPRGRRAEDGSIPQVYHLTETNSTEYKIRTEQNVLDSDGTLILSRGLLSGGTLLTQKLARDHGKPYLAVDLNRQRSKRSRNAAADQVRAWLEKNQIKILNVAGPRESQNAGIAADTVAFLQHIEGRNGDGSSY